MVFLLYPVNQHGYNIIRAGPTQVYQSGLTVVMACYSGHYIAEPARSYSGDDSDRVVPTQQNQSGLTVVMMCDRVVPI